MRDKSFRERILLGYEIIRNRTIENAVTINELASIIEQRLNLHQGRFERRGFYKDVQAMLELGLPVQVRNGKHNQLLLWGVTKDDGSRESITSTGAFAGSYEEFQGGCDQECQPIEHDDGNCFFNVS